MRARISSLPWVVSCGLGEVSVARLCLGSSGPLRPVSSEHLLLFGGNFKAAWPEIPDGSLENRVHEASAPPAGHELAVHLPLHSQSDLLFNKPFFLPQFNGSIIYLQKGKQSQYGLLSYHREYTWDTITQGHSPPSTCTLPSTDFHN